MNYAKKLAKLYKTGNVKVEKGTTDEEYLIFTAQKGTADESKVTFSKEEIKGLGIKSIAKNSDGNTIVTYTDNTFKINNQAISGTFDYAENYDFELMATDKIGDTDDYALVFATSVAIAKYHKNGADFSGLSVNGYIVPYFTVEEDWQE